MPLPPAHDTVPAIGMGKIPFWLRQRGLVSRTLETMRPGGYLLTRRAVDVCGFDPGDAVLDAGCGSGMTLRYLGDTHKIRATGLDRDPALLTRAGKKNSPGHPLVLGTLPELPFDTGTFKGIFCECVLSLVSDPARCLEECKRVLAPNGYLVVSDLYLRRWLPDFVRPAHPATCAQGAAPLMQMMSWIEAAGLDIHVLEDHSSLLCQLGTLLPDPRLRHRGSESNGGNARKKSGKKSGKKVKMGYTMIIARKV